MLNGKKRTVLAAIVLLVAGGVIAAWSIRRSQLQCACVEYESTRRAILTISRMQWQELDRQALSKTWPRATELPRDEADNVSFKAISSSVKRCCHACGTRGGYVIGDDGDSSSRGLIALSVILCRTSFQQALSDVRRLVEVAAPRQTSTVRELGGLSPKPVTVSYRWLSGEDTIALNVWFDHEKHRGRDRWLGSFKMARLSPRHAAETDESEPRQPSQ